MCSIICVGRVNTSEQIISLEFDLKNVKLTKTHIQTTCINVYYLFKTDKYCFRASICSSFKLLYFTNSWKIENRIAASKSD